MTPRRSGSVLLGLARRVARMANPVEWAAWLHGRLFAAHPWMGYTVTMVIFAAVGLWIWAMGVDLYNKGTR